jgi:hypothetical protein
MGMMAVFALLARSKLMIFCVLSIIATQLPVSFISPRGAFAIYIPVAFWGLYAAAAVNCAELLFRNPGRAFACYVAVATALVLVHLRMKKVYDPVFTVQAAEYRTFSEQLDKWGVRVPPNGRVLLINDPFRADWIGWDPAFLINLHSNTTQAVVNRLKFATCLPPVSEIGWYDYVIDYDSGWRLLKPPGKPLVLFGRLRDIVATAPVLLVDGFQPPVQDGWRRTGPVFTIRTRSAEPREHTLSLALVAFSPARLSVQLDRGDIIDEGVHGPGNIELTVPIPEEGLSQMQTLTFRVEDPAERGRSFSSQLLFVNAQLR